MTKQTATHSEIYAIIAPAITHKIAETVLCQPEALDLHKPLIEYGFDSLKASELIAFIEDTFGFEIEAHTIPDLVTTADVLQHLCQKLLKQS